MDLEAVSDVGLRKDVQVRVGDTLGPYRVELFNAAKAVQALTGATLGGEVWPRATPNATVALVVAFSDGSATAVDYYLGNVASGGITGAGSYFQATKSYGYRVWYTEAGGIKKTLVYGAVDVFSGVPTK